MTVQKENSNHGKNATAEKESTSTSISNVSTKGSNRRHSNRAATKGNAMMLWTIRKLVALCVIVLRVAAFMGK